MIYCGYYVAYDIPWDVIWQYLGQRRVCVTGDAPRQNEGLLCLISALFLPKLGHLRTFCCCIVKMVCIQYELCLVAVRQQCLRVWPAWWHGIAAACWLSLSGWVDHARILYPATCAIIYLRSPGRSGVEERCTVWEGDARTVISLIYSTYNAVNMATNLVFHTGMEISVTAQLLK